MRKKLYLAVVLKNGVYRQLIVELPEKYGLTTIYLAREVVELGRRIAYWLDWPDVVHPSAAVAAQILNGTKPGENRGPR
jgi:hypothetical protein